MKNDFSCANSRKARRLLTAVLVCLGFLCTATAQATTITVFGTGEDNLGTLLPLGALDPHYTITAYPGTVTTPLPAYVWFDTQGIISSAPGTRAPNIRGNGYYTYTTTFSLAGYNPATATLTGSWFADDAVAGVYLNGARIPNTPYISGWAAHQNFTATSGFQAGANTLSFVANQSDNWFDYMGVHDMTVTANPAVPAPATLLLLGSGLAGLGLLRRRKFFQQ